MEVFIPVGDSLQNEEGGPSARASSSRDEDPFQLYGTFLSRKRDAKDPAVIAAKGLLFYDKAKKEYVISNKDKIRQRDAARRSGEPEHGELRRSTPMGGSAPG